LKPLKRLNDDEKAVVIETELNERTFKELAEKWGFPLDPPVTEEAGLVKIADAPGRSRRRIGG